MVKLQQIQDFIASQPIAMAGVSRNPKKFGFAAFRELKEKGMDIIPVNPHATEIHGSKVYPDIKSLPDNVKGLIVMTGRDQTLSVINEAREKGIKNIWVQQMADTGKEAGLLEGSGTNLITKECILMYYKPTNVHKFHAALKKFFRRYPR
ncbi:MAG: CoA-binding protein [Bacteroidales bacterium]|jgi:predicted CoA-binding protein|nr:CoA-binding protein [Bacteroidales bacterium]